MKQLIPFIFLLTFITGNAQVIEQLSPQEKKQLTKVTEPITLYKGFLRSGLSVNFQVYDQNFDEAGTKKYYNNSLSGNSLTSIYSIQYGITDRLEFYAALPYYTGTVNTSYSYEIPFTGEFETVNSTTKTNGLGDLVALTRYQVIKEKQNTPALTLGLGVNIPTGKNEVTEYKNPGEYNGPVAKGEWGIYSEFNFRKVAYPFSFELGGVFIKYFGDEKTLVYGEDPVKVISGNEILVRPKMNFHLNEWVSFANYFDYYYAMKDNFTGEDQFASHNNQYNQWIFRYYPGITLQIKQLRLEQAVLIPLAGQVVTADPAFYFIASYTF